MMIDTDAKSMASRLRTRLAAQGVHITRSQALELVAAQLGYRDWNTYVAAPCRCTSRCRARAASCT